jgi:hypothetical protein
MKQTDCVAAILLQIISRMQQVALFLYYSIAGILCLIKIKVLIKKQDFKECNNYLCTHKKKMQIRHTFINDVGVGNLFK